MNMQQLATLAVLCCAHIDVRSSMSQTGKKHDRHPALKASTYTCLWREAHHVEAVEHLVADVGGHAHVQRPGERVQHNVRSLVLLHKVRVGHLADFDEPVRNRGAYTACMTQQRRSTARQ